MKEHIATAFLFLLSIVALGQNQPNSPASPKLATQKTERSPALPTDKAEGTPIPAALARGILQEEGNRNPRAAVKEYQAVIAAFDEQRRYMATALFRLGECYRKLGQTNEAQAQYQRVLREFPDQTEFVRLAQALVPSALSRAGTLPDPDLERIKALSQQSPDLLNATGKNSETLLQAAAGKGQISVVQFLLDRGAAINGLKSPELTALHFAAGNGHLAIVELLLRRGAKVDAMTESGVTSLHLAALRGFTQVAKALLEAGAQMNVVTRQDVNADRPDLQYNLSGGSSPLDIAVSNGYANLVELLLQHGADVNARTRSGGTLLFLAVGRGQAPMVELLVRQGAHLNAKDSAGNSPLHLAAAGGDLAMLRILTAAKAEINARNEAGETPLLLAAKARKTEAAALLLSLGADPKVATTAALAPLHFALAAADVSLTRSLLDHGADPNLAGQFRPVFMVGDQMRFEEPATPLEIACSAGDGRLATLLLEHGANPNALAAPDAVPLLSYPAVLGNLDLLKVFLAHKADPNLADAQGQRPLHMVAQLGTTNALALLVEHGANVNARTRTGATPLHYAVTARRLDMVEALVAAKADLNLTDDQGRTPLGIAKLNQTQGTPYVVPPLPVRTIPSRNIRMPLPSDRPSMPPSSFSGVPQGAGPVEPAAVPPPVSPAEIAAKLRQAGALEEIPQLDRIEVRRPSADFSAVLFRKGPQDWNQFTLLELIADWFGLISTLQEWRTGDRYNPHSFAVKYGKPYNVYPDFTRIVLRRPSADGRQWIQRQIDLSAAFSNQDCAGDIALQWGDVIQIPEADHPVNEPWGGLAPNVLVTLQKCLTRHVAVQVKGETHSLDLTPNIVFGPKGDVLEIGPEVPFMLRSALLRSGLILASSDVTHVKVSRMDPTTGQTQVWVLNCADVSTAPDFWLRDGDRVEIPEK